MISYNSIPEISINSVVNFKEYNLDRHENKKLRSEVNGGVVGVIPKGTAISIDEISSYYSSVPSEYWQSLSVDSTQHRIIVDIGNDNTGCPMYRVIHINEYYFNVGLQELEVVANPVLKQPELPHQILGFSSYDYGKKFGK